VPKLFATYISFGSTIFLRLIYVLRLPSEERRASLDAYVLCGVRFTITPQSSLMGSRLSLHNK
jgi:hypothetical protein